MTNPPPDTEASSEALVSFEYLKSTAFRVVHADGVVGGPTPAGNIHVGFYSERPPFPRKLVYAINRDGSLGAALADRTVAREGIIRELDVDVVMSLPVAEAFMQWLASQVQSLKTARDMPAGVSL